MNVNQMTAVLTLPLKQFPNDDLAAMNNAIQMGETLPSQNRAFKRAVEAKIVKPNGQPWELEPLRSALAAEVNRRVDAGTFD